MNILHISDIHFGRNYPEYGIHGPFDKHDEIIDGIIDVVGKMDDILRPEHIIFTGDIVWRGKNKEYKEALDWFRRLLKACKLTSKDISFCVGNHDIDLACSYDHLNCDPSMVERIDDLYRYENITQFEDCLYGYNNFCRELGVVPYTYPLDGEKKHSYSVGYRDVEFSDGKKIRIVSMNTALLMTQKKFPDDKMWLGREQLHSLIEYKILPSSDDIWYTIGLFHHSDRFLHPNETSSYDGRSATLPMLMLYANLLACGHTESSGMPRISTQPGGGSVLFGGAAYYNDTHINSFSILYVSDKKKKMGYIPYIYDGEWKECDFENDYKIEYKELPKSHSQIIENAKLVIEGEKEEKSIPFSFVEISDDGKRIISEMDVYNDFDIEYDADINENLYLSSKNSKRRYARTILANREIFKFIEDNYENLRVYLLDKDGSIIVRFNGIVSERLKASNEELLRDIIFIEDSYNVHFTLPEEVDAVDVTKISILKRIAEDKNPRKPLSEYNFGVINLDDLDVMLFNTNVHIPRGFVD